MGSGEALEGKGVDQNVLSGCVGHRHEAGHRTLKQDGWAGKKGGGGWRNTQKHTLTTKAPQHRTMHSMSSTHLSEVDARPPELVVDPNKGVNQRLLLWCPHRLNRLASAALITP